MRRADWRKVCDAEAGWAMDDGGFVALVTGG